MHEYSITTSIINILDKIIKEKSLTRVERVDFEINRFSSIEPQSIKFYFDFLTREHKVLKNAKLKFLKPGIKIKCSSCGNEYKVKSLPAVCPACLSFNSINADIDDIKIKTILAD